MKIIGIVGSPRRNGNTDKLVRLFLDVCQEHGIEGELVSLADKIIYDCKGCGRCATTKECIQGDDVVRIFTQLQEADGFILASPVYFGSITGVMKSFINRIGMLGGANGRPFSRKVGGALVVGRRAGHNFALLELLSFCLHQGMIVPGSDYWNVAFGRQPGEVEKDAEGLGTVRSFAENVSWLLKKTCQA